MHEEDAAPLKWLAFALTSHSITNTLTHKYKYIDAIQACRIMILHPKKKKLNAQCSDIWMSAIRENGEMKMYHPTQEQAILEGTK